MYVDKLDGKIIEKFYENKLVEWQTEMSNISDQTERHKNADISYLSQGIHILELANKAHALYLKQNHSDSPSANAKGLEIVRLPLLESFRTFKGNIALENIRLIS